jgi:hypothetical protein
MSLHPESLHRGSLRATVFPRSTALTQALFVMGLALVSQLLQLISLPELLVLPSLHHQQLLQTTESIDSLEQLVDTSLECSLHLYCLDISQIAKLIRNLKLHFQRSCLAMQPSSSSDLPGFTTR